MNKIIDTVRRRYSVRSYIATISQFPRCHVNYRDIYWKRTFAENLSAIRCRQPDCVKCIVTSKLTITANENRESFTSLCTLLPMKMLKLSIVASVYRCDRLSRPPRWDTAREWRGIKQEDKGLVWNRGIEDRTLSLQRGTIKIWKVSRNEPSLRGLHTSSPWRSKNCMPVSTFLRLEFVSRYRLLRETWRRHRG